MYYWLIGIMNPALYFSLERRLRSKKNAFLVLFGLFYLLVAKAKDSAEGMSNHSFSFLVAPKSSSSYRFPSADSELGKKPESKQAEPVFFYTVCAFQALGGRSKIRFFSSIITRH